MKKLLLSLALAAASAFSISAETATFYVGTAPSGVDYSAKIENNNSGNVVDETFTAGDVSIKLTKVNNSSSNVNGTLLRWYQGDIVTVTPANGATVTGITLNCGSGYAKTTTVKAGDKSTNMTISGTTMTWSDDNGIDQAFTVTPSAQIRISSMVVTYTTGQASNVSKPEISGSLEGEAFKVSISAEEGAEVYYTIDDSDPTAESTHYDAPFYVYESLTVKAIAVKDGESSSVASFAVEMPFFLDSFGVIYAPDGLDFLGSKIVVNCPMTAIWQGGDENQYLYVRDTNQQNMLVYFPDKKDFKNGDSFTTLEGTIGQYGKATQLTDVTFGTITEGTPVEPLEATLTDVTSNMIYQYLKIEGVTISGVSGQNATLTDADGNSVALRNQFKIDENTIPEGEGYTVTGFVAVYNGTVQFQPTLIEKGDTPVVLAAPVITPADGSEVAKYTRVIITAEEGCEIFYKTSLDAEDDPFTEYNEWSIYINGEIGSTFTVEAYAEKDGVKSENVSATYTLAKGDPELAWGVWGDNYELIRIDEFEYVLGVTTEDELPTFDGLVGDGAELSLTSSDPEVASINMEDYPWLTVHKAGTTYLTVAVTECEDYLAGEATLKLVVVEEATPPSSVEASFDFTDFSSLNFSTAVEEPEASKGVNIEDNTLNAEGVVLSFTTNNTDNGIKVFNSSSASAPGTTLRIYKNSTMSFAAPKGYYLTSIEFTQVSSSNWGLTLAETEPGKLDSTTWTATQNDKATKVTFDIPATNTFIKTITVKCEKIDTGVANIEAADENAPVEYFNLQGVRVQNPANGLYIRRQGNNVTKVIL